MSNANIEGTLQELWDGMKEIVPEFEWKGVSKNILFGYGKINREINKDVIKDRGIFSRLFRRTTESNTESNKEATITVSYDIKEDMYVMTMIKDNNEYAKLYGAVDDKYAIPENYKDLATIIKNIQSGKSTDDLSWLKDGDRTIRVDMYKRELNKGLEKIINWFEEEQRLLLMKVDKKYIRKKIEARKRNILKSRELRHEMQKRYPEEKVSGVVLADKIAEDKISGAEKRTITPETGLKIRRSKVRE